MPTSRQDNCSSSKVERGWTVNVYAMEGHQDLGVTKLGAPWAHPHFTESWQRPMLCFPISLEFLLGSPTTKTSKKPPTHCWQEAITGGKSVFGPFLCARERRRESWELQTRRVWTTKALKKRRAGGFYAPSDVEAGAGAAMVPTRKRSAHLGNHCSLRALLPWWPAGSIPAVSDPVRVICLSVQTPSTSVTKETFDFKAVSHYLLITSHKDSKSLMW